MVQLTFFALQQKINMRPNGSMSFGQALVLAFGCLTTTAETSLAQSDSLEQQTQLVPRVSQPDRIVIVVEENKSYKQILRIGPSWSQRECEIYLLCLEKD